MRQEGSVVSIGVHSSESIQLNKRVRPADSTSVRLANASRHADITFVVHDYDPSGAISDQVKALRSKGYDVVFVRGDDWLGFPGRECIEALGVPIVWHTYTPDVSSTKLRKLLWARAKLLPDELSVALLQGHDNFVYLPIRRQLTKVALSSWFPPCLTPNVVTIAALLMLLPCIGLLRCHSVPGLL